MLKVVVVARCDHCGGIKVKTVPTPKDPSVPRMSAMQFAGSLLPEGWVAAESEGEVFHFCCTKHQMEWLHL